jgi:hypothetical protein
MRRLLLWLAVACSSQPAPGPALAPAPVTVRLFFHSPARDPGMPDCSRVYQVTRTSPTRPTPAALISLLIAGASAAERRAGYASQLPTDAAIRSVTVEGDTARADFASLTAAGSCRVVAIRAEIEATLRANLGVRTVVISVDGNVDEALQP